LPTAAQPVEKQAEANSDENPDYGHGITYDLLRTFIFVPRVWP
jgi:hypothetical protein